MSTHRSNLFARVRLDAIAVACAIALSACGDSPPGPGPSPQPQPQPQNQPPVIGSIVLSASRAEVGTEVTVTATVTDAETAPAQLRYDWQADSGTFSGEGASVRWRAASSGQTPADITLRLSVVESYGTGQQHTVSGTSSPVRVHDSTREISSLVTQFLGDFANNSLSADATVRHFADSCSGKAAERADVQDIRDRFQVLSHSVAVKTVTLNGDRSRADVVSQCEFNSKVLVCPREEPNCGYVNRTERARGDCVFTSVYEQQRWWLCTSNFINYDVSRSFRFTPFFQGR